MLRTDFKVGDKVKWFRALPHSRAISIAEVTKIMNERIQITFIDKLGDECVRSVPPDSLEKMKYVSNE
jgi:hypothetical protein